MTLGIFTGYSECALAAQLLCGGKGQLATQHSFYFLCSFGPPSVFIFKIFTSCVRMVRVCVCMYACVCHTVHVEGRGQPQVFIVALHLI